MADGSERGGPEDSPETPDSSPTKEAHAPEPREAHGPEPDVPPLAPETAPAAARAESDTSRRYPVLTRTTSRPQGGRRVAPGSAPAPVRQWPLCSVLGGALLGLAVLPLSFRAGLLVVGGALLAGAVLRWTLPAVGMLAVRSRFTDIVTYGLLGTLTVLLTVMAQPRPWIEVPFLNDVLRFSAGG